LYAEVLGECRKVHPGIGSGKLAYAINDSRVLDARVSMSSASVEATGSTATSSLPREVETGGEAAGQVSVEVRGLLGGLSSNTTSVKICLVRMCGK
jgi:hypothetical protein